MFIDSKDNSRQKYLSINNGYLTGVDVVLSKNFNERPSYEDISLLVIHCASLPFGEYDNNNLDKLFSGNITADELIELDLPADFEVSTHLYIKRNGDVIQFVPFEKRAWHAGRSEYQGKVECNDYSIGIELQGTIKEAFTEQQYQSLIKVTKLIMQHYPLITKEGIVGHSDIAPSRKQDPGEEFDWEYYLTHLA